MDNTETATDFTSPTSNSHRNAMFSEYNNVMCLYQENMRLYQENFRMFLQSPNTSEQRRTARPARRYAYDTRRHHQTRNLFLPNEYPDMNSIYTTILEEAVNSVFPNATSFSDVLVYPSEQQVSRATTLFLYNSNEMEPGVCPITLEDFQHDTTLCKILHCGHVFRERAIKNWFLRNVRCPVCRYDIRDFQQEDVSNNRVPVVRPVVRPAVRPVVTRDNNIVQNLSTGLSSLLRNYLNTSGEQLANNEIITFEFPVYYDASSNLMNMDIDVD